MSAVAEFVIDHALDAVVITNDGGKIVAWNDEAEAIFGWTAEEAIGRRLTETILPSERLAAYAERLAEIAAGPGQTRQRRHGLSLHRDGHVFPSEVSITAISVEGSQLISHVIRDVTEQRRVEDDLREANALLQALLEAAPLPICAVDLEGLTTLWNAASEREFGWAAEEVLGKPPPTVPEDRREAWDEQRARIVAGETMTDVPTNRNRRDGSTLDVSLSVAPVHGPSGEVTGVLGISIDVTERERAYELLRAGNEERRQLLAKLVRAQEEERQRIAADIHDDSVQVLTALALRLEMLRRKLDDPAALAGLAEAEQTARLTITRLRHLMFELRPPALDRDGLVVALRMHLEQVRQTFGIDFTFENRLASEPEDETRALIYRIAQEAVVNAAKHAQPSRVEVQMRNENGAVVVRITDDGRGFEVGQEARGHLGLVFMRERAEMAGGWCRIDSIPGGGTVVEFAVLAEVAS